MLGPGTYILFGRTGVGKSSLINNISGKPLASTNAFQACTSNVEKYQFNRPAGQYILYDSPGLFEDEDDETDLKYLRSIAGLLTNELSALRLDSNISIVLVTRLHASRLRAEDYGVFDYFCRLLNQFPRLKPVQIFTFANIAAPSFLDDLLRARARSSVVCDYYFSMSKFSDWVSPVFKEFYAVDNLKNLWISSSNDSIDLSPIFAADDTSNEFESMVGLPWEFLRKWYCSAPFAFPSSDPEFYKCLVNRVLNISSFSDNYLLPGPWLKPFDFNSNSPVQQWESKSMLLRLQKAKSALKSHFYFKSSVDLEKIVRSKFDYDLVLPLWDYYASTLSDDRLGGESGFQYLIFLLEVRYISLSLLSMVRSHNLSIVSTTRAFEIFHHFKVLLESSTALIGDKQGKAWLIDYMDYMLLSHVSQDLISRDAPIVSAHLINSSTFLYLATYFLEWISFPQHPREVMQDFTLDFSSLASWIDEYCPVNSSPAKSTLLEVYALFAKGDLRSLAAIDQRTSSGLRLFVKYVCKCTDRSRYMVSSIISDYFGEKSVVHNRPDDFDEIPF